MYWYGAVLIYALWLIWITPFVVQRRKRGDPQVVQKAPVSRVGIALQAAGIAILWLHIGTAETWLMPLWRLIVALLFGLAGTALGTSAVRTLGKQWRVQAALIADHELVQIGPYNLVRHPIYASMLLMALATGFAVSQWPQFIVGMALFLMGQEIRVRAEDRLLAGRFGPSFDAYRSRVRAYIPFVR